MIRALLVDDHTIFRTGLRRLLSDEADIRVTDEAKDVAEMFGKLRGGAFDVVLLDVNMAGRSGLEAMQSIRAEFPRLPVLLHTRIQEGRPRDALTALSAAFRSAVRG